MAEKFGLEQTLWDRAAIQFNKGPMILCPRVALADEAQNSLASEIR
jgi:hypothetical protein